MQKEDFTEFDLQVRSMLKDAEEEVPSRVWDAVNSRIGHRKVIPVWWRRAAVGMAAAAAVTAVVIFTSGPDGTVAPSAPLVAEVLPQEPSGASFPDEVPSIEEQIETAGRLMADVPAYSHKDPADLTPDGVIFRAEMEEEEEVKEAEDIESHSVPVTESDGQAPAQGSARKQVSPEEEKWTDPFALMAYEDAHSKSSRGVSLFIEGNVTSNDRGDGSMARKVKSNTPEAQAPHTGVEEKSISTYGIPLSFGIGARYRFSDRWSIGTGINYTLLSRTFTGVYSRVGSATAADKSVGADVRNNLHYLGIPLNIYFDILSSPSVQFYVYAGGQAEKGLVNHYRIMSKPIINYQESVPGIQWSAAAGLGVEFNLGKNLGLYVDPSARYYFDCGQPHSVRTQKPYMLNFEVGFRFNL